MSEIIIDGSYPIRNELLFDGEGNPYPSNGVGVAMMTMLNKALYSDGIPPNDLSAYSCTAIGGMTVEVRDGLLLGGGVFHFLETATEEVTIDVAGTIAERRDMIAVQFSLADKGFARIVVLKGKHLATDLIQTTDVYQKGLCIVRARQNATSLTQADLTDVRLDPAYCGIMSGILQVGNTDVLWRQFETELNAFLLKSTNEYNAQVTFWENQTAQQQADFTLWFNGFTAQYETWADGFVLAAQTWLDDFVVKLEGEYQAQVEAWEAQMAQQQSDFEDVKAVWEEWFFRLNIDIQVYATFNFDNLAALAGVSRDTTFPSETFINETITINGTHALVATRETTFNADKTITIVETLYSSTGEVLRSFPITVTFNNDGSVTEEVA